MKRKKKMPASQLHADMHGHAEKIGAQTMGVALEGCKEFGDSSFYAVYARKGAPRATVLKAFRDLVEVKKEKKCKTR